MVTNTKTLLIEKANQQILRNGVDNITLMLKEHEARRTALENKLARQSQKMSLEKLMGIFFTRWLRFSLRKTKPDKQRLTRTLLYTTRVNTLGVYYRRLHSWGWYKLSIPRNRTILDDLQTAVTHNKQLQGEVNSLESVQRESAKITAAAISENEVLKGELGTERKARRSSEIMFQREMQAAREMHEKKQRENDAAIQEALDAVVGTSEHLTREGRRSSLPGSPGSLGSRNSSPDYNHREGRHGERRRSLPGPRYSSPDGYNNRERRRSLGSRHSSPNDRSLMKVQLVTSSEREEQQFVSPVDVPRTVNTTSGLLVGSPILRPHNTTAPNYSTERMIRSLQRHRKQNWKQKVSAVR